MAQEKKTRTISARIEDDLYATVESLAKQNTRSMSHQVEHMLKLAIAVEQQAQLKDPLVVVREAFAKYHAKGAK